MPTTDHRNTMTSLSAWMKFHPYAEAAATPAVGEHTSHRFGIRRGSRKRWLPYVPTHYHGIFHRQLAFFFFDELKCWMDGGANPWHTHTRTACAVSAAMAGVGCAVGV